MKKILITIILLISLLLTTNVYAVTNTPVNGTGSAVKLRTYLILDNDALVPEFTFEYTIVGISETISATGNQEEVLAPTASQIPKISSAKFRTVDYASNKLTDTTGHPITLENNQSYLLNYSTIDFRQVYFNEPGNYRYIVTRTVGNYDGVVYDTTHQYYVDVIVISNETGNLSISEYTIRDVSDNTHVNVGESNKLEYGYFVEYYNTYNLEITLDTEGNQVDHTLNYNFIITTTSADTNKAYKYIITKADNSTTTGYLDSGVANTLTINEDDSIKIYGLSANDTYRIYGEDKSNKGYSTTYTPVVDNVEGETVNGFNVAGTLTGDTQINYIYTRNIAAKTGVFISVIPYAIMVGISIMTIKYINKKKID